MKTLPYMILMVFVCASSVFAADKHHSDFQGHWISLDDPNGRLSIDADTLVATVGALSLTAKYQITASSATSLTLVLDWAGDKETAQVLLQGETIDIRGGKDFATISGKYRRQGNGTNSTGPTGQLPSQTVTTADPLHATTNPLDEEAKALAKKALTQHWTTCGDSLVTHLSNTIGVDYIELKGVYADLSRNAENARYGYGIGEADRLNGIEWRGVVEFRAKLGRIHLTADHVDYSLQSFGWASGKPGWSKWFDGDRNTLPKVRMTKTNGQWSDPDVILVWNNDVKELNYEQPVSCDAVPGSNAKPTSLPKPEASPLASATVTGQDFIQIVCPGGKVGEFHHGTKCIGYYDDKNHLVDIQVAGKPSNTANVATKKLVHAGVDIVAVKGSAVFPIADGTVIDVVKEKDDPAFAYLGYMVIVKHDEKLRGLKTYSLYLHMNEPPAIAVGKDVVAGKTQLGAVGSTGAAFGPHIHLEVRHFSERLFPHWGNIYGKESPESEAKFDSAEFSQSWTDPETFSTVSPVSPVNTPATPASTPVLAFSEAMKAESERVNGLEDSVKRQLRSFFLKAQAEMKNQRWTEAIANCEKVLSIDPQNQYACAMSGKAYERLNQFELAEKQLSKALQLIPADFTSHLRMFFVHAKKGEKDAAITSLQMAVKNGYSKAFELRTDKDVPGDFKEVPKFKELTRPQ